MNNITDVKNFFSLASYVKSKTLKLMEAMKNDHQAVLIFLDYDQYYLLTLNFNQNLSCTFPNVHKLYQYLENFYLEEFLHRCVTYRIKSEYCNRDVILSFIDDNLLEIKTADTEQIILQINSATDQFISVIGAMEKLSECDPIFEKLEKTLKIQLDSSLAKYIKKRGSR